MKQIKIKEHATPENVKIYLEQLEKFKKDFRLEYSTYYTNIILGDKKIKFNLNQLEPKTFIAAQMIKKDINERQIIIDNIDRDSLEYFHHNASPCELDTIINIDLKSAYATILFNDGIISEPTYKYLISLKKTDRLAAVGILASKKSTLFYENGKLTGSDYSESEYSKYFFYAVKRTHEIIRQIEFKVGFDFLFSWVDGIYFKSPPLEFAGAHDYIQNIVNEISKEIGITLHFNKYKNYVCKDSGRVYFIKFLDGKKEKIFNLPKNNERLIQKALNFYIKNSNKYTA